LPKGYFGYNESHAMYGTFGAWSPLILFPYVVFGKIIGWSFYAPIVVNALMMVLAFAIWAWRAFGHEDEKVYKSIVRLMTLMLFPLIIRFSLSRMSEAVFVSLIVIYGAMWLFPCAKTEKWMGIIAFYLSLCRPYYIMLFFPLLLTKGKRLKVIIGTICATVIGLIIRKEFCAPYFGDIIRLGTPLEMVNRFRTQLHLVVWKMLHCIQFGDTLGETYLLLTAVSAGLLVAFIVTFIREKRIDSVFLCGLGFNMLIGGATLGLYEVNASIRHILPFIMLSLMAIIEKANKGIMWSTVATMLLLTVLVPKDNLYWRSQGTDALGKEIEQRQVAIMEIVDTPDLERWNNTVVVAPELDYRVLYSVPDGLGINLCTDVYLETNDLKSKWLIQNPEYPYDIFGYSEVYRDQECILMKREDM